MSLCNSIESAIQWFQIHYGITFVTIHNPAVYLSGARVSIIPTLVPRLYCTSDSDSYFLIVRSDRYRLYELSVNVDHKTCIISTEMHMFL